MTEGHFQRQISRLSETFGKTAYSHERVALLWREMQDMPDGWFARVVDRFIGEMRQAPLMPDFRDEIAKERERNGSMREPKPLPSDPTRVNYRCSQCSDNGVYLSRRGEEPGVWAFRCHCSAGERDPRKLIPQFKETHIDEGFIYYDLRRCA